jgi:hypothetical protein
MRTKADPSHQFERRHQAVIFKLRTGHIGVNAHLHRTCTNSSNICANDVCNREQVIEDVDHLMFRCPGHDDIRQSLLPRTTDIDALTWSTDAQILKLVVTYSLKALERRELWSKR